MAGLDPAIHVFTQDSEDCLINMDARIESGHDGV